MRLVGDHGWDERADAESLSDASTLSAPCTPVVARSLGVSHSRLSAWMSAGLIRCSSDAADVYIELNDAALLRSLCATTSASNKLRATLDRMRAWLPTSPEPLRCLTLVDRKGPLLLRLADGSLADATGQFRFDRNLCEGSGAASGIYSREPRTPYEWHEQGVAQEGEDQLQDAAASYTRALLVGGPDAQIMFDLAHVLAELNELDRAVERYRQVVELDPLRQDAWVNLGDLLQTLGRHHEAIDALRRALDLDPDDPAAHYNLADVLDRAGDTPNALLHWEVFLSLADASSEQARYALNRLETC